MNVAIIEIGGSHDECILTQVKGLKEANCRVIFCGTKDIYERNSQFQSHFDDFYEVKLTGKKGADFKEMRVLNNWLKKQNVEKVICNTAQGGHIRNLAVISLGNSIQYYGVLHTTKKIPDSFTQKVISLKIKNYFVLNDTLLEKIPPQKKLTIGSFYPIDFPHFDQSIDKKGKKIVTMIGGVENRRKDLKGFIEFARNSPDDIQFVFLGKSDSTKEEVIEFKSQIEKFQLEEKIKLFDHFISEETFDAYLKSTDLILPLVHPNTPSAVEYFNRQIPGSINIAFSYKIPMLIEKSYSSWEDFKTGCMFYDSATMNNTLESFFEHQSRLKNEIGSNPKFSASLQRKNFATQVLGKK